MSADALTLARAGHSLAKTVVVRDGIVLRTEDPPWPRILTFETVEVSDPGELLEVLAYAANDDPAPCVVRAHPLADVGRRALYDDAELGPAALRIVPRSWVGYDLDKVPAGDINPLLDPWRAVAKARRCLHPAHHDTTVVWQVTASAGKRPDELRLRLWFLLDRPMLGKQLERWLKPAIDARWLDPVTLRNEVIPHFIGVKILGNGPDPCPSRWGMVTGEHDRVPVPHQALVQPPPRHDGFDPGIAGNLVALKKQLGPRFDACRRDAVAKIRSEIETVRAAGDGSRHPCYLRAAARIKALCEFWRLPLDPAKAKLEQAYLETLTPHEAHKRERGSTRGVWQWLERRGA